MIKAVARAVALAEVLGLCLREQLVTLAAHFKFQSLYMRIWVLMYEIGCNSYFLPTGNFSLLFEMELG